MPQLRKVHLHHAAFILLAFAIALSSHSTIASPSPSPDDEKTIWNLEHSYWQYVEANNLPAYLELWHNDFLGWPSVSASPVRKYHITDWITSQTTKGLAFKTLEFKPAGLQITGNVAIAFYWLTSQWLDKDGKGPRRTLRVTHTWLRTRNEWRIIGGMSMPEQPDAPQK